MFSELIKNFFLETRLDGPASIVLASFGLIMIYVCRWHERDSFLDLRTILIDKETDRVSLHKFGQFIALTVSTGAFWYEMLHGRLSEWLFISYMLAWSGANIASKWLDNKRSNSESSEYDNRKIDRPIDHS